MTKKIAMAAQYTEVSLDEIEKFLKRSFRVLRPVQDVSRGEVLYDLKLGKFVGIRVWTSVHRGQSSGAGAGQDAIRVGLISLKDKGPLERGKLPIVKRTQNWRDSLTDKIEDCIEKYEEKDEFWEAWAETRKRQGDPERVMHEQEREEERVRDEDGEGDHEPRAPEPPPAPPVRQYDPARMQGGITDPQMNFLRVLMRGMTQAKWEAVGAPKVTGLDEPPRGPDDVRGLSKGQASLLIDALKRGGSRYAHTAVSDFEVDDSTGTYDLRRS